MSLVPLRPISVPKKKTVRPGSSYKLQVTRSRCVSILSWSCWVRQKDMKKYNPNGPEGNSDFKGCLQTKRFIDVWADYPQWKKVAIHRGNIGELRQKANCLCKDKGYIRRNDSPLQLVLHLCSNVIASFWTTYNMNNTSSQAKSMTFGVMKEEKKMQSC